jgi:ribosome biogenesis GTPase
LEVCYDQYKELRFTDQYEEMARVEGCIPARVIEVHREIYKVVSEKGECTARLKGSFYNNTDTSEDFPAVGDFVQLQYNEQGDSRIVRILPRNSKFSRPDYSGHATGYVKTILEQVVAANFDYVFILASLNYDFNINRIMRYITVAWESGGTPVVLLDKSAYLRERKEFFRKLEKSIRAGKKRGENKVY